MGRDALILRALYRLIYDKYINTDDIDLELLELRNELKKELDKLS